MESYWFALLGAVWLGILTSISPCPLATNVAAISYVGRRVGNSRSVISAGLLYAIGRSLTYLLLGIILVNSLLAAPSVSHFLQKYMNKLLGPVLILAGMFLLELLVFSSRKTIVGEGTQKKVDRAGVWGAALLGFLFALSFCPVSAALFFGSLLPLAVKHESAIILPSLYGFGTALPVSIFAVLLAAGAESIGRAFNVVTRFEFWGRRITGLIFILVGVYYCLTYIFAIHIF
ncbi:MAG TPA: aromatic aminobenezylarsenical efflux permease ArsG family transporter [candidate division Zixibacteria bacterium]|nr:aromatic aminobenezylarsenical efflux permease ArsG family transporter [candidate division Zixibacteria bacterium]